MDLPRRILVVDDDASIRDVLAGVLGDEGYRVATAADGASALPLVAADPPQVIILDMRMPGMSGWDLAEALREAGVAIPVVCHVMEPGVWTLRN